MTFAESYQEGLVGVLGKLDLKKVNQAIEWFREARAEERHIFVCGNGGSGATASHFACDVLKCASYDRPQRFRIQSLSDPTPTITAFSNDVAYEVIFEEQLKSFAREGDLVMALSGSGNSPNVVRAVEYANSIGCRTIALTGHDGGKLGPIAGLEINVPYPHMGRIEDAHMAVCHMIAYYFIDTEA